MSGSINKFDYEQHQRWPLIIKNESGHTLPAFGCAVVTGLDVSSGGGAVILTVERPTSATDENAMLVFNSQFAIPNGGTGRATVGPFILAGYSGTDPAVGDTFDKTTNSFLLSASGGGPFICWGVVDSTNNIAAFMRESSATGDELIFFKAPTGGIPPRVSNLDGSATCDVYEYSDKSDTGDNAVVQNWAETAICDTGNRFGWAVKVVGQTYYAAIAEDCSSTGGTTGSGTGTFASGTITSTFPDLEAVTTPDVGVYNSGSHSRTTNLTPGFE